MASFCNKHKPNSFFSMLPKDIMDIIDEYNEIGIFICYCKKIYWFNGKRFEIWCRSKYYYMLTYNNDLYYRKSKEILMYKNRRFEKVKVPEAWNHPLRVFSDGKKLIDNDVYKYHWGKSVYKIINKHGQIFILPQKNYPQYGLELLGYDNCLYYFGSGQNEKFVNGKWDTIAQYPNFKNQFDIYSFDGKFYAFEYNVIDYYIYDSELDCWELKIIK